MWCTDIHANKAVYIWNKIDKWDHNRTKLCCEYVIGGGGKITLIICKDKNKIRKCTVNWVVLWLQCYSPPPQAKLTQDKNHTQKLKSGQFTLPFLSHILCILQPRVCQHPGKKACHSDFQSRLTSYILPTPGPDCSRLTSWSLQRGCLSAKGFYDSRNVPYVFSNYKQISSL